MPCPGQDVLPMIGMTERRFQLLPMVTAQWPPAAFGEVTRVVGRLPTQDAVYRANELNEFIDRPVSALGRDRLVMTNQFEFVHNGVLALLLPMIEKDVLE